MDYLLNLTIESLIPQEELVLNLIINGLPSKLRKIERLKEKIKEF